MRAPDLVLQTLDLEIGRGAAVAFAKEGARLAVSIMNLFLWRLGLSGPRRRGGTRQ